MYPTMISLVRNLKIRKSLWDTMYIIVSITCTAILQNIAP